MNPTAELLRGIAIAYGPPRIADFERQPTNGEFGRSVGTGSITSSVLNSSRIISSESLDENMASVRVSSAHPKLVPRPSEFSHVSSAIVSSRSTAESKSFGESGATFGASQESSSFSSSLTSSDRNPPSIPYNRKDRSLAVLCENFLAVYRDRIGESILLNEAAQNLGVQRRRIYDIVNVLEVLEIVKRKRKNSYLIYGLGHLSELFITMKLERDRVKLISDDIGVEGTYAQQKADESSGNSMDERSSSFTSSEQEQQDVFIECRSKSEQDQDHPEKRGVRRSDHSLATLARRFLALFFDEQRVSLDEAAMKLFQCSDKERKRNCVRRVYDIGNIMMSLGIVQRVRENGQTFFCWCLPIPGAGTCVDPSACLSENISSQSLLKRERQEENTRSSPEATRILAGLSSSGDTAQLPKPEQQQVDHVVVPIVVPPTNWPCHTENSALVLRPMPSHGPVSPLSLSPRRRTPATSFSSSSVFPMQHNAVSPQKQKQRAPLSPLRGLSAQASKADVSNSVSMPARSAAGSLPLKRRWMQSSANPASSTSAHWDSRKRQCT